MSLDPISLLGGFKTATGIFGAFDQRKLDRQQVEFQYEDNLEKIRRRDFTQKQTLGRAKAFTQASGVRHTGGSTAQGVIDAMSDEFKKELDYMKKYAVTARRLGVKSAKADFTRNLLDAGTGMFEYL